MSIPQKTPIGILGIAVDNLTMEETIAYIQNFISRYAKDGKTRYITSLNAEYLVHLHSWFSSDSINPELLHILRESCLINAEGASIRSLSWLLGYRIKTKISSVDLIPRLAETMALKYQALFLLGGEEKSIKLCMLYLQALYPGISIVGASHSIISIKGEFLENAEEKDALLIEQINRSNADVLLLNLGNFKQEIWFERVRQHLKVPIVIGVGKAFDLLTGISPKAPNWMQKFGLEWLFKFYHRLSHPSKFLINLIKFPFLTLPLIIYNYFNLIVYKFFSLKRSPIAHKPLLFLSTQKTLTMFPLPPLLNAKASAEINNTLDDLFSHDAVVFDFHGVKRIDSAGMAFLLRTWRRSIDENRHLYALRLPTHVVRLLKLHRFWDYISPFVCLTPRDVLERLEDQQGHPSFFDAIEQEHQQVVISFFGSLDNQHDYESYLKKIGPILYQKACVINLSYCTYIDNIGIGFLLRLRKIQPVHISSLKLKGLNPQFEEQLQRARVLHLFQIEKT